MFKPIIINIESLVSIIISISDVAVTLRSNQTQVISFYMSKIELYMGKLDFRHVNDITCVWLLRGVTAIGYRYNDTDKRYYIKYNWLEHLVKELLA